MLDSRDVDRQKFAPMSAAAFQALQVVAAPSAIAPTRQRDRAQRSQDGGAPGASSCGSKVRRYKAQDFHYSSEQTNARIDGEPRLESDRE